MRRFSTAHAQPRGVLPDRLALERAGYEPPRCVQPVSDPALGRAEPRSAGGEPARRRTRRVASPRRPGRGGARRSRNLNRGGRIRTRDLWSPDERANQAAPRPGAGETVARLGPARLRLAVSLACADSSYSPSPPARSRRVRPPVGNRPVAHRRCRDRERGSRGLARPARRSRPQAGSPRRPADGRGAAPRPGGRRQPARDGDAARLALAAAAQGLPRLQRSAGRADRPGDRFAYVADGGTG